jgi:hypothetical protein
MKEMAQVTFASLKIPTTEIPMTTQAHAAPPRSGIRALMLAVLEEAIHSLRSPDSRARAQAELWMTSRERRYIFSFAAICETLGLEPRAVCRSVIGLLDKKSTGHLFLKRSRPNVRHSGALQLGSSSPHGATVHPQIRALRKGKLTRSSTLGPSYAKLAAENVGGPSKRLADGLPRHLSSEGTTYV